VTLLSFSFDADTEHLPELEKFGIKAYFVKNEVIYYEYEEGQIIF